MTASLSWILGWPHLTGSGGNSLSGVSPLVGPLAGIDLAQVRPLAGWLLVALGIAGSLQMARMPEQRTHWDWQWCLLIVAVLLCFRWPLIWLPYELNADESQLLSGAITLRHDPLFWRAVDGNTAGPLDFYPLLAAAFFPGVTGFAIARLTAVLLIAGTIIATGEAIALLASRALARVTMLPLLVFECLTTSADFIPYSTELVPGFLLALAAWAIARQTVHATKASCWFAALLLGATPFAKLQAAPLAAVLGLLLLVQEWRAGRRSGYGGILIAALLPTLIVVTVVSLAGEMQNMIIPYFHHNVTYIQAQRVTLGNLITLQWHQAMSNGHLAIWLMGSLVSLPILIAIGSPAPKPLRHYRLASAILLLAAAACILAPGRPYNHYFTLAAMPLGLLLGTLAALPPKTNFIRPSAAQLQPALVVLLCGVLPQLGLLAWRPSDPFHTYNFETARPSAAHHQLVAAVKTLAEPGEALGLWGWRSSLYVETGLRQATRQAHCQQLVSRGPWQNYYLTRYLDDLKASRPPVFVDAAGPGNFWFSSRKAGHEIFPGLKEWVGANYTLTADVDGTRVYARNDRTSVGTQRSF